MSHLWNLISVFLGWSNKEYYCILPWLGCQSMAGFHSQCFILFSFHFSITHIITSVVKKKGNLPRPTQQDSNVWLKVCFLLIPIVNFHHSMLLKSNHLIWRMHCFCGSTKSQQCWMKISWRSRSNMQNNFYRTKTKPNDSGFAVINCNQKCRQYFLWWKNFWKISVMGKVCLGL